jgi:transcriptional regulator with XRE-family HTH domain
MNKLREVRIIKRISQFELRLKSGIHQSKISMIENNLMAATEEEKLKLAEALGVRPEKIWGKPKPIKNSIPIGEERAA